MTKPQYDIGDYVSVDTEQGTATGRVLVINRDDPIFELDGTATGKTGTTYDVLADGRPSVWVYKHWPESHVHLIKHWRNA